MEEGIYFNRITQWVSTKDEGVGGGVAHFVSSDLPNILKRDTNDGRRDLIEQGGSREG